MLLRRAVIQLRHIKHPSCAEGGHFWVVHGTRACPDGCAGCVQPVYICGECGMTSLNEVSTASTPSDPSEGDCCASCKKYHLTSAYKENRR